VSARRFGVLVTRPAGQADALCERIEALGWRAIRFPTVEIVPVDACGPWREADYDFLVFVSRNSVIYGLPLIQGENRDISVAVVGRGTARQLEQSGRSVDVMPAGHWNSEGLLAHPDMRSVSGKRILIVRGEGGRPLLGDELEKRGANVEYAEVYRRVLPAVDATSLIRMWPDRIHLVIVTSNEILANLATLLGDSAQALLRKTPLLVVSERGKALARSLGCGQVILAAGADDEALVSTMLQWAENANL